jgi:iron-sulfur cluster assembly protein
MIELTPAAKDAVKSAIARSGKDGAALRIMIEAGGCSGYKYLIGLDTDTRPDDAVVEEDGVRVLVDAQSQPLLTGLKVDFVSSLESSGFTFNNPNASAKCGCGKSFC